MISLAFTIWQFVACTLINDEGWRIFFGITSARTFQSSYHHGYSRKSWLLLLGRRALMMRAFGKHRAISEQSWLSTLPHQSKWVIPGIFYQHWNLRTTYVHICKKMVLKSDSNRKRKRWSEVVWSLDGRWKGASVPQKGERPRSRVPSTLDRQVKGIGRLRQHFWTLWRLQIPYHNHPVSKAEQVIIVHEIAPFVSQLSLGSTDQMFQVIGTPGRFTHLLRDMIGAAGVFNGNSCGNRNPLYFNNGRHALQWLSIGR